MEAFGGAKALICEVDNGDIVHPALGSVRRHYIQVSEQSLPLMNWRWVPRAIGVPPQLLAQLWRPFGGIARLAAPAPLQPPIR